LLFIAFPSFGPTAVHASHQVSALLDHTCRPIVYETVTNRRAALNNDYGLAAEILWMPIFNLTRNRFWGLLKSYKCK
jgi:hypothetical protein